MEDALFTSCCGDSHDNSVDLIDVCDATAPSLVDCYIKISR